MQFDDPVAAGATLVRVALQSADYVAGVSGWRIARNGDVEFNSGNFRGDVVVTSSDGTQVTIQANNGSQLTFRPPTAVWNPLTDVVGYIASSVTNPRRFAYLNLVSPSLDDATHAPGQIVVYSEPLDGVPYNGFEFAHPLIELRFSDLWVAHDAYVSDHLFINDNLNDIGEGIKDVASQGTNSGAIAATETAVLTTGFIDFFAGRAYRFEVDGGFACSVANSRPLWQIRKGATIAGTQLGLNSGTVSAGVSANTQLSMAGTFISNTNQQAQVSLTLQGSGAFTATMTGGNGGRTLTIRDVGKASYFPDAKVI